MNDARLFAAMLRAVLNLEHWPTDVLEREVQRLLDIAGLELAPIGAGEALAGAVVRESLERAAANVAPDAPPHRFAPRVLRFEDGSTLALPPDPRVEMDARTRRISAGLEAPPPGLVTTFHAMPEAVMRRCVVCHHLEHGSAVCGARVPLTWSDSIDARVPDTCQCEGEPRPLPLSTDPAMRAAQIEWDRRNDAGDHPDEP